MLFPAAVLNGIVNGGIDRSFRRWDRPRVKVGGTQRTPAGVIGFSSVEVVERGDITEEDAERSGFASLEVLLRFLDGRAEGLIYRIGLELVGPDPRVGLRDSVPDDHELEGILTRLERFDRDSRHGPWTLVVLEAIRDGPSTPAAELAAGCGREKMPFKLDVRKLKELGLTESLRPGYRLSPRGRAVVAHLASRR
jgi:hypothetical protein